MKVNALLDVNLVAHESEDEVAVLLEVQAPPAAAGATRAPASLQVVLDRSGSMHGAPLEGAKRALVELVRRLDATDNFGLVAFDDTAQVVVAAGPVSDKDDVVAAIASVTVGGSTDLSAGYLRALRELRRVMPDGAGGTVLVVSDGHVNGGVRDVDEFSSLAAKAHQQGIVTSTLGYGQGYDETLLAAVARSGSGNHVFARDPDAAAVAIADEVDGLLDKVAQAVSLTVRAEPAVQVLRLYNDLPAQQLADGSVMIELGDLYADEVRKVLLKLHVPALPALGLATVATLELAHVELPGLVEHTTALPISVNVVPGDEAAARVAHPTVRSEVLFQEAQDAKRRASEAFEAGDLAAGKQLLDETHMMLDRAIEIAPAPLQADMRAERDEVDRMGWLVDEATGAADASRISKMTRDSYHRQNRKRGRTERPD